jgi:hypothetical protein
VPRRLSEGEARRGSTNCDGARSTSPLSTLHTTVSSWWCSSDAVYTRGTWAGPLGSERPNREGLSAWGGSHSPADTRDMLGLMGRWHGGMIGDAGRSQRVGDPSRRRGAGAMRFCTKGDDCGYGV